VYVCTKLHKNFPRSLFDGQVVQESLQATTSTCRFSAEKMRHLNATRCIILWVRLAALRGADSHWESLSWIFQREVILCWFCEVILWNELRGWELEKKIASPDSVKRFSMLILRVYAKQSKRITFSHRITSPVNQGVQLDNQGAQLCRTDPIFPVRDHMPLNHSTVDRIKVALVI
jgi:hypothetical protein